ncbi:MAG: PAS domain S-box protein [Lutispora sp.]|nr:PAS domain S-box protein [Lutispora sp.]
MKNKLSKYTGFLIIILTILILEYSAITYRFSTILGIFTMLIIFSIYKGGILSGAGSSIITISYLYYLKEIRAVNSGFFNLSSYEFILDILVMLGVSMLAAIMHYKYVSYYERFKEGQLFVSRAEEISEIMICHSFVDGRYLKVPEKLCSLLGYTESELIAMPYWQITHPEDALREEKLTEDLISGSKETYNIEKRLYKKNGEIVWTYCNVSAVKNDDGEIVYLLRYLLNITEQQMMKQEIKRQQKELRYSESKYRSLIELAPDAVMIHEGDIISFINNAGIKMFGVSNSNEIIGKSIYDFIHPDYIYNVKSQIGRACINLNYPGAPFELKIVNQKAKEIDVEAINVGLGNGDNTLVMAMIRDITERKNSEELKLAIQENEKRLIEAKEYDRVKNEFFANISHELRTPLNVILGTLQLLTIHNGNSNKDKMKKYLGIMKQNCYRLLRLVSNLIDITKIDAGYFDIKLGCHDIVGIVEDVALSVADYIQEKQIEMEFDTDVDEKTINCDPDQIERIMLNLLSNAIKFTKPGGKISVSLYDNGSSIIIRVKDTGIGIEEDKQKIIFERFRQVDKSLTRDHEGSGIGLSLVKSLVEMHGGMISLISKPNQGSVFIIELPVNENAVCYNEKASIAEAGHIERIKVEFSDIYS